jgi:transglutaminase-like putative cysteine protease
MATFYIKHHTEYTYSDKVIDGANQIKLYPINDYFQKVGFQSISISGNPAIETNIDYFGNLVGTFMFIEPHNNLSIVSSIEVTTINRIFPDNSVKAIEQWKHLESIKYHIQYIDFLKYKTFSGTQDILELIKTKDLTVSSPYIILLELCEYVYKNFKYIQGLTNVNSTLSEVWDLKAGVCQDFTSVFLQMVRMFGIPARYVSGYICPSDTITRGEGATHAWVEAYIPFYGWLGVDPTNNAIANENHVRLAVGRDYNDCSPVKGVFKGNVEDSLHVKVEVSTENVAEINTQIETSEKKGFNSYRQNLEKMQQQQQQQQ